MKVLIKSAWGSDESTKAAFAFLHANAFAKAGHDVQIFLLGEAVNLMRSETMNAVTPVGLLTFLTVRFGFVFAMVSVSASMLATLIPVAMAVLRPRRTDEYDSVERAAGHYKAFLSSSRAPVVEASGFRISTLLRSGVFISISVPFALGLTAQVGFLTHQVGFLTPMIGTIPAGWAVSLTTFAAVLGRIATGYIADNTTGESSPVATLSCRCLVWQFWRQRRHLRCFTWGVCCSALVSGIRHHFLAFWCSRNFRSSILPGSSA